MVLRLVVLLVVLALLARRFLPRRRMSWAVPLVLGVTVVVVRGAAYVLSSDAGR